MGMNTLPSWHVTVSIKFALMRLPRVLISH